MVKNNKITKLFKHEILAWSRVLLLVYGILLSIAGMGRIIQIFESDSWAFELINGSAIFFFFIATFVCCIFPTVFGIVRFYKNLFTGEGYLTFTLPISPANHIRVKLLTALLFDILTFITVSISILIMISGDVFEELINAIAYLLKEMPETLIKNLPFYIIEVIIYIIIAMLCKYLLYYLCISVGQLFRKNRVLAAVGVYFGYYIVSQILGTIFVVLFTFLGELGAFDGILTVIGENPYPSVHIALLGFCVLYGIVSFVYYLITHYIIKKKLNLE